MFILLWTTLEIFGEDPPPPITKHNSELHHVLIIFWFLISITFLQLFLIFHFPLSLVWTYTFCAVWQWLRMFYLRFLFWISLHSLGFRSAWHTVFIIVGYYIALFQTCMTQGYMYYVKCYWMEQTRFISCKTIQPQ